MAQTCEQGVRERLVLLEMAPLVDAVAIATANDTHVSYGLEAIKHGLHIFVDKPLATKAKDAQKLYKAAKDKGLIGLTTLSSRGHPVTVRARELLAAIKTGRQAVSSLLEGVQVQYVIDAAEASAKKDGKWTSVSQ